MKKQILNLGIALLLATSFSGCSNKAVENNSNKQENCQGCGEDSRQQQKGINGDIPDVEYSYEGLVNGMSGIYQKPEVFEENFLKKTNEWQQKVAEELKKVQPLDEDASEEQIQHLFKQLIYTVGRDFSAIEDSSRFGYVVFKDEMENPFTKEKITKEDANVNIEIVLDASGSMENKIGDNSMMTVAKESIMKVIDKLPENANVGLRVFGHRGDNSESTKDISCSANELLVPIEKLNKDSIKNALDSVKPAGWTSIAKSIENGKADLEKFNNEKDLNILYIVTDGVETCDGNPVEAAKTLKDSKTNVVLGIVGFNVDANQNKVLKQIADAGNGKYSSASDADKLTAELYNIHELAFTKYKWENFGQYMLIRVQASQKGGFSFNKIKAQGNGLSDEGAIKDAIQIGEKSETSGTFPHANLYKPYGKVEKRLRELADERKVKVDKIFNDKLAEIEKQIDNYLASLESKKGKTAAYIYSTSRLDIRSDYYTGLKNKGGTTDSEKQDKEKIREEQTKSS